MYIRAAVISPAPPLSNGGLIALFVPGDNIGIVWDWRHSYNCWYLDWPSEYQQQHFFNPNKTDIIRMYTLKSGERIIAPAEMPSLTLNERFKSFVAAGATFDFRDSGLQMVVKTTTSGREYLKFVFSDGRSLTCSAIMRSPSNPDDLAEGAPFGKCANAAEVYDLVRGKVLKCARIITAKGRDFGDTEEKEHKYSVWVVE